MHNLRLRYVSHGLGMKLLVTRGLGMKLQVTCGLGMRLLMDMWFGNEATGDVWSGNEATKGVWSGNEATNDFTARRWVDSLKDFEQTPTSWSIFSASLIDLSGMPRVRLVPLTTAMISFRLIIPSRFVSKVSAIFSSSICVIASPGQRGHAKISSLLFQKS